MTNGEFWRSHAEQKGIPLRSLADVTAALAKAKKNKADDRMASLMLRHGHLTDEALLYIGDNYPTVWE